MKYFQQFSLLSLLVALTACETPNRQTTAYSTYPPERSQVISTPQSTSGSSTASTWSSPSPPSSSGTYQSSSGYQAPIENSSGSSSGQPESDRILVSSVEQNLSRASIASAASNVRASAQNGVVTLTGSVPSDQDRQAVVNIARTTPGVTTVYDQLQVASATGQQAPVYTPPQQPSTYSGQGGSASTPGGYSTQYGSSGQSTSAATGDIFNLHVQGLNETDRNLAQRILEGLRTDSTLASLLPTVNINVANGRVVLQGNVENTQQKRTIASVVQRAAGAQNVDDQLRVNNQ